MKIISKIYSMLDGDSVMEENIGLKCEIGSAMKG